MRLRTQLAFYFLVLLILKSMLIIVSIKYIMSENSRDFYRERGTHLARSILAECIPLVYYDDVLTLSKFAQQQINTFPDLRYIAVMNMDGSPVWSSFSGGIPEALFRIEHPDSINDEVSSVLIRSKNELMYDYEGKRANVRLRMGMSLAGVQQLTWKVLSFILLINIGGIIAIFLLSWYISKPVESLHRAIERALSLGKQTTAETSFQEIQEVEEISKDFHLLMDRLEERTRQLDASRKQVYLGEIASNIAHEINNPLGVIVMNCGLLMNRVRKGELSDTAAKEITRLHSTASKVTLIVQKFLQFARYTVKGGEIKYRQVNLKILAEETLNLLQDKLHLSGCTSVLKTGGESPAVYCDEQGIQQVLFNLLTNAIDASSRDSEITIEISASDEKFIIRVSDQGEGMTEEVKSKAFEPFFTTKEIGQGTGLGLAISSSIVNSHGGTISIDSKINQGTSITIVIPSNKTA